MEATASLVVGVAVVTSNVAAGVVLRTARFSGRDVTYWDVVTVSLVPTKLWGAALVAL